MATMNDSFLADLEELVGDLEDDHLVDGDRSSINHHNDGNLDHDNIPKLEKTQRYKHIMQQVEHYLRRDPEIAITDDEYHLIVDCNSLLMEIDKDITVIHNYIREKYRHRFPELESLARHPIDYARVIKKIGDDIDLTPVSLEGLLPPALIMVVSITASTTPGKPLHENLLGWIFEACDRALDLDSSRKKLFEFTESRVGYIAPNLSAIVGSSVAARLIGTAGGLLELASLPVACNAKKKKKNLGWSSTNAMEGVLEQTEIFQSTPPSLRDHCFTLLASKSSLAARVDYFGGDPSGNFGRMLCGEIRKKIEKKQEPNPPRLPKPLPVPVLEPKKRRGGCRVRKMKQRYAMTDMRKLANRVMFGVPEESSLGDGLGVGLGMLSHGKSGKLGPKVDKKFKGKQYGRHGETVSGIASSLAFTPDQGIQLPNPHAEVQQLVSGTQRTYFL